MFPLDHRLLLRKRPASPLSWQLFKFAEIVDTN